MNVLRIVFASVLDLFLLLLDLGHRLGRIRLLARSLLQVPPFSCCRTRCFPLLAALIGFPLLQVIALGPSCGVQNPEIRVLGRSSTVLVLLPLILGRLVNRLLDFVGVFETVFDNIRLLFNRRFYIWIRVGLSPNLFGFV
jgi:hypothetical protein